MLLIISDASVLIDIEHGDLTNHLFHLPYQFAVPDILFSEELQARHGRLIDFGLEQKTMDENMIKEAYLLRQTHQKPSLHDLLALTLAKHEKQCY